MKRLAILPVVAALALAACGSDEDDSTAPNESDAPGLVPQDTTAPVGLRGHRADVGRR